MLNLDRQSVGRLDRVEIVKGASSALYGSDAIGGVINLITRDVRRPFESLFTVPPGSTDAFDVRGEAGVQRGAVSAYVTVERHQRDAWDLTPTTPDTTGADFGRNDALAKVTFQLPSRSASDRARQRLLRTVERPLGGRAGHAER